MSASGSVTRWGAGEIGTPGGRRMRRSLLIGKLQSGLRARRRKTRIRTNPCGNRKGPSLGFGESVTMNGKDDLGSRCLAAGSLRPPRSARRSRDRPPASRTSRCARSRGSPRLRRAAAPAPAAPPGRRGSRPGGGRRRRRRAGSASPIRGSAPPRGRDGSAGRSGPAPRGPPPVARSPPSSRSPPTEESRLSPVQPAFPG